MIFTMKLTSRRRRTDVTTPGLLAPVRVDPRTKNLTKRLRAGEIAVIDHLDIDRVAAEALVAAQPAAILNASKSISGRYPNLGPEIIVEAGITLIDDLGPDIMALTEGQRVQVDGAQVLHCGHLVAEGELQTAETIEVSLAEAREGLSAQLEAFAANTMDYLRRERELLLDGVGVPEISTKLEGRQALIVVRGYHCPPVQQPYFNTLPLTGAVPDGEILELADRAYAVTVAKLPQYRQRELAAVAAHAPH